MKNWTVRRSIVFGFALLVLAMIAVAAVAAFRLLAIQREAASMEQDSVSGLYIIGELRGALLTEHALARELILADAGTAAATAGQKLRHNRAQVEGDARQYEATIVEARDRALFEAIEAALVPYFQTEDEISPPGSALRDRAAPDALTARLETQFERVMGAVKAEVHDNKSAADESVRRIRRALAVASGAVFDGFALIVLLAFVSGYFLFRSITRPLEQLVGIMEVVRQGDFTRRIPVDRSDEFGALAKGFNRMTDDLTALVGQVRKSGLQVNTSVTEIAATAKEQQATADEIAATTTEIGATSREISATSQELLKTMTEVSTVAGQSAELAGSGQTGLARMEETMRRVIEAAGSISGKLAVLSEKAGNINQVVATITKVADQTNLLSFNAAIEAEKAGEYGRGFAIVATEIRRLEDQTAVATATRDIGQMVKEMHSAVSAGVMGMDKFSEEVRRGVEDMRPVGGQLSQIIQQVQAMTPRFEAVNEGMQTQATGAQQISEALGQLSEAAQQTVDSLRQSGHAIDELNQVAGGLRSGVSRFKLQAQPA